MATAATGQLTLTRKQIRQRVARRLGDYMGLIATANGSTTTFIDTTRLAPAREQSTGRQWVGTSGSNDGVQRGCTGSGTTLTLSAAVTSTLTGDTADLYNKRGTGWLADEYNDEITTVLDDAAGFALIEVVETVSGTFDADTPEVTAPASLREVYAVEWEDSDSVWHRIPAAERFGHYGWIADAAAGQLRIQGGPAWWANGYALRIFGYGRQDTLASDTASCALDPEYVIAQTAFNLAFAGMDRDPGIAQKVLILQQQAEMAKRRMARVRHPDAKSVRLV
jgi:hypothetical protein